MTGAELTELTEIAVCALRPAGSALHLLAIVAFVVSAWLVRSPADASRPRSGSR